MAQEGLNNTKIEYNDIMIIGKTGMGKSTTADKLLIATPTNIRYEGVEHSDPNIDEQRGRMTLEDLVMWNLSDTPDEVRRVTTRLKNLVFFRGLDNPHEEINKSRQPEANMYIYEPTKFCELISNETSMVRVLDVPGYFGADAATQPASDTSSPEQSIGEMVWQSDLRIMRNILRIQAAMGVNFKRIVYFLPEKGPLTRPNAQLQQELKEMAHYFGKSVFNCMVLVASLPSSTYRIATPQTPESELFSMKDAESTQRIFQDAMYSAFPRGEQDQPLPEPPLIFLSLFDSCERVFEKIMNAAVIQQSINLSVNPETCARCAMTIKILKRNDGQTEKYACHFKDDSSSEMPYEESTCHPRMIPKYSRLVKFAGGVAHLVTFRRFQGRWPSFGNTEEICLGCNRPPHTAGCVRVGTEVDHKGESIPVDHTKQVQEEVQIQVEDDPV